MIKAPVYSISAKKLKERSLPAHVFEVPIKHAVILETIKSYLSSQRRGVAHTKGRGEQRGGGRKPWRQKGTGRARHGSSRSPIWRGGGVTFGPTNERNYVRKINKKVRQKSLCMALSDKAKNRKIIIIDSFKTWGKLKKTSKASPKASISKKKEKGMKSPYKTRDLQAFLHKLPIKDHTALIIMSEKHNPLIIAERNLPQTTSMIANSLTTHDLMRHDYLIVDEDSVNIWDKRFLKISTQKATKKKISKN